MFDPKSRYARLPRYVATDRRGRPVPVVPVPEAPVAALAGHHMRKQGERLDHLAAHYLDDPAGYWRICELDDVMDPEALSEAHEVPIPARRR